MLMTAFMSLVLAVLYLLIAILPTATIDSGIGAQITAGAHALATFNGFIPLSTVFVCLGIIFVIELGVLLYRVIDKVRKMFPTQS